MPTPNPARLLATAAALAFATHAGAVNQTVTFTNVFSNGNRNASTNDVRTGFFPGGFNAQRIIVGGTLNEIEPNTWASEAQIAVTSPNGDTFTLNPFLGINDFSISVAVTNPVTYFATPVPAAGFWEFRFFETRHDSATGFPDAIWPIVVLTLDSETGLGTPTGTFLEVEPNNSKGQATQVGINDGQTIGGVTTGSLTSGESVLTADYFRVRTRAANRAIYRHVLTLSTTSDVSPAFSIRGLTQDSGVISSADTSIQGAAQDAVVWYGFGKEEEVYIRLSGSTSVTAPYTLTKSRTTITPTNIGTFTGGPITISTVGQATSDTDLWVYDANFNAIPNYGNDDESVAGGGTGATPASLLTRTYQPGTYYLAISDRNLANNLPSPADDDNRSQPVLDFPNALITSDDSGGANLNFSIADAYGHDVNAVNVSVTGLNIAWFKFTVVPPPCPGVDFNQDGGIDVADIAAFFDAFTGNDPNPLLDPDLTLDGGIDVADIDLFFRAFAGGPC